MDPLTLSAIAWAIGTGVSTVAGKLIEKGVVKAAPISLTDKIK